MSHDRRLSVTVSEDDLRPHMRKPRSSSTKPAVVPSFPLLSEISEVEKLQKKAEQRKEVKREVRRRVEEEERAKEQRKNEAELRKESQELLTIRDPSTNNRNDMESFGLPYLSRRVNNFQYFKWNSDEEISVLPGERPVTIQRSTAFSHLSSFTGSGSNFCELCTLALQSIDKTNGATKSAACAHVDAFAATASSTPSYSNYF